MANKTVGFIGLGNMASAILSGLKDSKVCEGIRFMGYDVAEAAREKACRELGVELAEGNGQVASRADILFLAVKPLFLESVLHEISGKLAPETVLVSIVAGRSLEFIETALGRKDVKIVRCMPNTPALVAEGCTGVCANEAVTRAELEEVLSFLRSVGRAIAVPERLMDAVVGISGSAPAYVFLFIEALADAGVAAGLPRQQAYEFAAQAVFGSAKMVLETGKHPGELKDMVCSPGGTTIEAVKILEENGFRGAVMKAVEGCVEKSKNL